jgi:hypothetical protein
MSKSKKTLIPCLVLTQVADAADPQAVPVALPTGAADSCYHVRPLQDPNTRVRVDDKPKWVGSRFNLFPLVLDAHGVPWAEATVYLLSRLENSVAPVMSTYSSIADDLSAYLRFIEESGTDWQTFPAHKLNRPTYRYSGHLRLAVQAGEIAGTTAKRRMGSVIAFYTWLRSDEVLNHLHLPTNLLFAVSQLRARNCSTCAMYARFRDG